MNKKALFLLGITAMTFAACSKTQFDSDRLPPIIAPGTYTGTFQRQTLSTSTPSIVLIVLDEEGWHGSSSIDYYPALCSGTYTQSGSEITFTDTCEWPDGLDLGLTLNGVFRITHYDDTLVLSRQLANSTVDIYKLQRQ